MAKLKRLFQRVVPAEKAERIKAQKRASYHRNKATAKAYRARNRDKIKAWKRDYSAKNHDQILKRQREWARANPEKRQAHRRKHRYGLPNEEYNRLLAEQGGACAICHRREGTLAVDHDHNTDDVRGLLCRLCNAAIGSAREDIETLKAAVAYLERYEARRLQVVR